MGAFIGISALLVSTREQYVHSFRGFDLNFGEAAITVKHSSNTTERHLHTQKAELWLRRSQDYRRMALYITYSSVNMVIATYLAGVSLVLVFLSISIFVIPILFISFIFFLFMFVAWMIRYRKVFKPDSSSKAAKWFALNYEKLSLKMSESFPPLLPPLNLLHLNRWPEIEKLIDEHFRNFLHSMDETSDIQRNKMKV